MRGLTPDAPSRVLIAAGLPSLLADDDFAQRLTGALDEVVAPLYAALDNLPAYLDARLAPPDFLQWLASWVGVEQETDQERLRGLVIGAVERHAGRGTPAGVRLDIAVRTGLALESVTILDSGGVAWSQASRSTPPGSATAGVSVRLSCREDLDRTAIDSALAAAVPAHLPVHLDVEQS